LIFKKIGVVGRSNKIMREGLVHILILDKKGESRRHKFERLRSRIGKEKKSYLID